MLRFDFIAMNIEKRLLLYTTILHALFYHQQRTQAQILGLFVAAKRLLDNCNTTVGGCVQNVSIRQLLKTYIGCQTCLLYIATINTGRSALCLSSELFVQHVWPGDTTKKCHAQQYSVCLTATYTRCVCTMYSGVWVNLVGGL